MTFKDLVIEERFDGVQAVVSFCIGFEVSIVRHGASYGNDKGLYEIGVFNAAGGMCDPLGWGDDVKGWLTPEGVETELILIESV